MKVDTKTLPDGTVAIAGDAGDVIAALLDHKDAPAAKVIARYLAATAEPTAKWMDDEYSSGTSPVDISVALTEGFLAQLAIILGHTSSPSMDAGNVRAAQKYIESLPERVESVRAAIKAERG